MRLKLIGALLVFATLTASRGAAAQESWLEVVPFPRAYGVFMRQGSREERSSWVVVNQETLARVSLLSAEGVSDLKPALNKNPRANYLLLLDNRQLRAGSYVVAFDRVPSKSVWQASYFNQYLAANSLTDIIHERFQAGKASAPARAVTSDHYKAIVQVGQRYTDLTKPIGQDLEIIPLNNPGTDTRGQAAEFQVLFKGDPLAGKEVTALCRVLNEGKSQIYHTDSKGRILFPIDKKGVWIVQSGYAHPAEDSSYDWRLYEASLTFTTR